SVIEHSVRAVEKGSENQSGVAPGDGTERLVGGPYDALVDASPQGSIYCRRWWLEAVAPGAWRILTVEKNEHLHAAWPIVLREHLGRTNVVMPMMTQKLGILFPAPRPDQKYVERLSTEHKLIKELLAQLPEGGAFRHSFHESFTNWQMFYWHDYKQTTRYTYLLEDLHDHDKLWENMRGSCRGVIRNARKQGLEVDEDVLFEDMLALNDMTFERQSLETPVTHDLLRRIDRACSLYGGRRVFGTRDRQGRLHAAVYVVWDHRTMYALMLGSDPKIRHTGALKLAVWEAIKFARQVVDRWDFEGSMMPSVEASNRDLGGVQRPYFVISRLGRPNNAQRAVRKLGRMAKRVLPLRVTEGLV
ncbi:MAG: GNAT family N-acetyltransferase, partial [Phycisphaeraceae bacterium]